MSTAALEAVVLAGGSGRRLGGADKPAIEVGGTSLLERVLEAVAAAGAAGIVVVGPVRPLRNAPELVWTREDPPGAGPVAALAAGLAAGARSGGGSDPAPGRRVAVLAADLPFLDAATLTALRAAGRPGSGAVLLDDAGRPQWLVGVWDRPALLAALTGAAPRSSLRSVLEPLAPTLVHPSGAAGAPPVWWDCDDPSDLETARRWLA
jgi:molybdopterin-guanine dinucleotide biosynthesis protein A